MNGEKLPSPPASKPGLNPKVRLALGLGLLAAGGSLVTAAMNSSLFAVKQLTVTANAVEGFTRFPVELESLESKARLFVRNQSVFRVSASGLRKLMLEQDWVGDARVRKGMDGSISVQVDFRMPVAIELSDGPPRYLDRTGQLFGQLSLELGADFPVVDVSEKDRASAVDLVLKWQDAPVSRWLRLMAIDRHSESGWVLTTAYQLATSEPDLPARTARMTIELGRQLEDPVKILARLSKMGKYLVSNGIEALSAKSADGKKLVVKTARRF
jgi:hypothetical protein